MSSVNFGTLSGETGTPGGGTVTSVALTAPTALFQSPVSGSPVVSAGTLALALANQSANTIFAGPSSGAAAAPTWRALLAADIPGTLNATTFAGNVTLGSTSIQLGAAGSTLVGQFISSPANLLQLSGPTFPGFLLGATGATTGTTAQYAGTKNGLPVLAVSAGNLSINAGIVTSQFFAYGATGFANASAVNYAFGFADAAHANIYTNGVNALSIDSSQNATFSATVKVQSGGTIRSGSGAPAGALGSVGDIYLNTAAAGGTTNFYVKTGASTWTAVA